jgi:hypothetical protein
MSRPRFRFTLGQAGLLIVLCAVAFALLRTPGGSMALILVGPVLPGFILGRVKGGRGIVGGMLSAALASVGYGLAFCLYDYFFHDPADVLGPASLSFLLFFWLVMGLMGLLWGIFVSILFGVILKFTNPVWQKYLTWMMAKARREGTPVHRGADHHGKQKMPDVPM